MTTVQKVESIAAQIQAIVQGRTNIVNCPYCGAQNRQPSELMDDIVPPICCPDFALAMEAAIFKLETDYHLDAAERIAEGAVKGASIN